MLNPEGPPGRSSNLGAALGIPDKRDNYCNIIIECLLYARFYTKDVPYFI